MKSATLEEIRARETTMPLRALILEDSRQDVETIVQRLQESGFEVSPTVVESREEYRAALAEKSFDAVVASVQLGDWSGLEALAELRAAGKELPFVLLAGALNDELAAECKKQGATDCIAKDRMARLPVALARALAEKAMREENARALEALSASEARNRDIVENAVYGIARISTDGGLLDANPAFLRMLGCSSEEALKSLNLPRDIFRFPEQYAPMVAACREQGPVSGVETEWRRCDGGLAAMRLHLRQLSNTGDRSDNFEVIAEDVTELRGMELQLRQAQKFEAIGQLAGGVAHDFNNVIGAILGWAELGIEQSCEHPAVAERFQRIREQADRAARLTRELLAFSRRQVLQPRPVDLNSVASDVASLLDKVIGKDIEFRFLSAPLDSVKADPTQIEQVLMNLCLNARDAMPRGGRLVIETEMVDLDKPYCRFYPYVTPGRYAVLSVSDTGTGMDAETREHLFEPFFTTKERGKGTGMGLATVYGIVKQHGGFLHVYSEPGHGSLFRVYLPAIEIAPRESERGKAPAPSMAEMRGTETILLADDHESIREMARQALAGLGYRVLSACDGEEALRLCKNETPALAILDVVMPKLGGLGAASKLAESFPQLRVLFTSGYSTSHEEAASESPNGRYLQKPYSPTTLGQIVREMLDAKREDAGTSQSAQA
jgi:two-component system, cell cycle sensor histidine kinase and response regulator CckA